MKNIYFYLSLLALCTTHSFGSSTDIPGFFGLNPILAENSQSYSRNSIQGSEALIASPSEPYDSIQSQQYTPLESDSFKLNEQLPKIPFYLEEILDDPRSTSKRYRDEIIDYNPLPKKKKNILKIHNNATSKFKLDSIQKYALNIYLDKNLDSHFKAEELCNYAMSLNIELLTSDARKFIRAHKSSASYTRLSDQDKYHLKIYLTNNPGINGATLKKYARSINININLRAANSFVNTHKKTEFFF